MTAILLAALVLALGVSFTMAMTLRHRWVQEPSPHYEETLHHLQQAQSTLQGTERQARERFSRRMTDEERVVRLEMDAALRHRDHSP